MKIHREKRSRNANAYYWELVGRIGKYIQQPNAYVHNELLRNYGTLEKIDGEYVVTWLPDSPETEDWVDYSEDHHLKATHHSKLIDGKLWTEYLNIKGSRYYDTAEMSRLIDGAVSEAKGMDIETLPPDELERMMRAYEEHYASTG